MAHDPKTNRSNRELEKAKKRAEIPPLELPFPFRRESFDPFFFGLQKVAVPKKT